MIKFRNYILLSGLLSIGVLTTSRAQNPVVQTIYTADPAPMVYQDTVFLYTGHDEEGATFFTMNDYKVYSSTDMVNWTDRGTPLSYQTFNWAKGDAWAAHCIERDGKFYWYVTLTDKKLNRPVIGVAVSDHATGPFKDALGKPLVAANQGDIDPAAFIDDDGQAYLYWGNPKLWYVKLNEDMISYDGAVMEEPLTPESFGKREGDSLRSTLYEEAPWLYKRQNTYYLFYAAGGIPEYLAYSTSDSPVGPWSYQGVVMPTEGQSFTNHPGVIDFKGNSYLFYHNGALPGGGGFARSVAVEPFSFGEDGTVPELKMTSGVKNAIHPVDAFRRVEAETMAFSEGVKTEEQPKIGVFVTSIQNGDWLKVRGVDLKDGAERFKAAVKTKAGGSIEIRMDDPSGPLLTTLKVAGDHHWQELTATDLQTIKGIHDLYFVFKGEGENDLFDFDYWYFE
ncbi:family 43 glycosylhydrolase [Olivibacter sp. SDN3]|nr:family 43 glycosylhydrolase [Olivibacter sp. SDN3]